MMGWSTSPSTKSTTTSWPMRGRWTPPNWVPAPSIATRTQQELLASDWPSRSQWNWILTRPYLSGKISSPAGPTTTAVCTPPMRGAGVMRGGRNGKAMGMQVKELEYSKGAVGWLGLSWTVSGCLARCSMLVSTNLPLSEKWRGGSKGGGGEVGRGDRQGDGDAGEGIGIFEGRGGVVGVVVDSEWLLGIFQFLHLHPHRI